jgi:hypothetical protein
MTKRLDSVRDNNYIQNKISRKRSRMSQKIDLSTLEAEAFPPNHPVTLSQLKNYLYAKKAAENSPEVWPVEKHSARCTFCQQQMTFLMQTDPLLNGEEDKVVKDILGVSS